eukprot:TRINITY_DN2573_c0_g2_i2.p1 TRINITY_DN2573_c0_g2~~TRINITY_DN2573_c0_g2_i2.p1  ORF type:complete len:126 (+),score=17.68 TRINITY_DN2573_c0_g2_i2:1338-1715(+)
MQSQNRDLYSRFSPFWEDAEYDSETIMPIGARDIQELAEASVNNIVLERERKSQLQVEYEDATEFAACIVCERMEDEPGDALRPCFTCDGLVHQQCCRPPLRTLPIQEPTCPKCKEISVSGLLAA